MTGKEALTKVKELLKGYESAIIPLYVIEEEIKVLEIIKKYVSFQEEYDEIFKYGVVDKQYVSSGSSILISDEDYKILKEWSKQ